MTGVVSSLYVIDDNVKDERPENGAVNLVWD